MLHRVDSFMDILGFCFLHSKELKKHECLSLSIQVPDASQLILVTEVFQLLLQVNPSNYI